MIGNSPCNTPPKPCNNTPLVWLEHVSMGWEHRMVLNDVSLKICKGDFLAITGPNGGGKTTLLRIILGLLKPTVGRVYRNLEGLKIGYLPQKNMIDSHFPITVNQVIKSGLLTSKGLSNNEKEQRYREVLALMGLENFGQHAIGALSGGQLQRAMLGRAIISRPGLLVLDEPLSYIDKRFENQLYNIIEQLAKTTTILLVSHEMSKIAGMANRHLIVDGHLHECAAHHHFVRTDCE